VTATSLPDLASAINEEHRLCAALMRRGLEHARRAGELLIHAKAQLAHGEWLPWLKEHCDVSVRQAENYARIAKNWTELAEVADSQRVANIEDMSMRRALGMLGAQWSFDVFADPFNEEVRFPESTTEREPTAPETWQRVDIIDSDYRCPSCGYEWNGNPKPWHAGGRAMADARDRRNGIGHVRLAYPAEQRKGFLRLARELKVALGAADVEAAVFEAVKQAHVLLAAGASGSGEETTIGEPRPARTGTAQ
jgi:hypothetical protein